MNNSLPTLSALFTNQYGQHLPKQGWTKWGGAIYGLMKEELDEWYCQACGEKQVKTLPSYMFPLDDFKRDYIRVCAKCKALARVKRISYVFELIHILKGI